MSRVLVSSSSAPVKDEERDAPMSAASIAATSHALGEMYYLEEAAKLTKLRKEQLEQQEQEGGGELYSAEAAEASTGSSKDHDPQGANKV